MGGGKGKGATTLIIGVLVLLVVGMAGYIIMNRSVPEEKARRSVLVTEDNVEQVAQQMEENAKKPVVANFTPKMNSHWRFPDGKSPSADAFIANSDSNEWPVWFDVTLNDGRVVYESPILPVDTHVEQIALSEELEKGVYNAVVTYHVVDEEQNELTTLKIGVTIEIQNEIQN